jgi:hypothetical protein
MPILTEFWSPEGAIGKVTDRQMTGGLKVSAYWRMKFWVLVGQKTTNSSPARSILRAGFLIKVKQ